MSRIVLVVCMFFGFAVNAQPVLQEGLSLKYLVQLPAEQPQHTPVIILLHGYGSDERDLFELRTLFPRNYLIIAPRAPYALQGGGYEWYEGKLINDRRDGNPEQLADSRAKIIRFIDEVRVKYKAASDDLYLVGFSQGAIMSYEVGLTAPGKVKGIGALSGIVFTSLRPLIKNTPALKQLKIFIAHGKMDDRIKFKDGKETLDYLTSIGLKPNYHSYINLGHSISNEVMRDLLLWLK